MIVTDFMIEDETTSSPQRNHAIDWKQEHGDSFEHLKLALPEHVLLANSDFSHLFILSADVFTDELSQVQEDERKTRLVAFAINALTCA